MSTKKQLTKQPEPKTTADHNPAELSDGELESVTGGASDYLLKIDGIKGESVDDKHTGEIELLSWSFGASREGAFLKK